MHYISDTNAIQLAGGCTVNTAVVEHAGGETVTIKVENAMTGELLTENATSALPYPVTFGVGDKVLVTRDSGGESYIIGVVSSPEKHAPAPSAIETKSGVAAAVECRSGNEHITIRNAGGALLFDHDTSTGRSVVHITDGDLEFKTEKGNITLNSGGSIDFNARRAIGITVCGDQRQEKAGLKLSPHSIEIGSPVLNISNVRTGIYTQKASLYAHSFEGKLTNVRIVVKKIESVAETVIEKAQNMYTSVKQLTQLRTGRLRTVVDSLYHFKSNKVFIKTEKDYKVKSEKIHLG